MTYYLLNTLGRGIISENEQHIVGSQRGEWTIVLLNANLTSVGQTFAHVLGYRKKRPVFTYTS